MGTTKKLKCIFHPQAPGHSGELTIAENEPFYVYWPSDLQIPKSASSTSDIFRFYPNVPNWIAVWRGPCWVEVIDTGETI